MIVNYCRHFLNIYASMTLALGLVCAVQAQDAPQQSFAKWLEDLRNEALQAGISPATIEASFATVQEPIPRVLELDRSQPEFVQTFAGYMKIASVMRASPAASACWKSTATYSAAFRPNTVCNRIIWSRSGR